MFYQSCLKAKEFSRKAVLVPSLQQNLQLSTFQNSQHAAKEVPVSVIVWDYVEKYQLKRVACYCYYNLRQTKFFKKTFGKCSQIECFKVRNSTRQISTLRESPSSDMLQNKRKLLFSREKSRGTLRIEVQVDVG